MFGLKQDKGDRNAPANAGQNESALEVLRRRYASGEIDQAQYEEMKRVLGAPEGSTAVTPPYDDRRQRRGGC